MCFSPEADLVGGITVGLLGIDAVRHVAHPRELPLATLPLLLGAHQLIETFVWWGLRGVVAEGVGTVATWAYLVIAFVVLPPLVPSAIRAIEPPGTRRLAMGVFVWIGWAVAVVLLLVMLRGPVTARLEPHHVAYGIGLPYSLVVITAYVVATCGSLLVSSVRLIVIFGAVNLPAIFLLALFAGSGFASLWCAWAAVTSTVIVLLLRAPCEEDCRPVLGSVETPSR